MTREQFTEMVQREQEPLRRFLLALCCGDREEADDIAQEALVKAYLSLSDYEERGKGTAWLYRIAYRTFLDSCHSRSLLQPLEVMDGQEDTTYAADRDFRYQSLYLALEKLPPKERSALLLFYIGGYSVREIAGIMDATEDAVKKRLSRGRKKLKTLLEDEK